MIVCNRRQLVAGIGAAFATGIIGENKMQNPEISNFLAPLAAQLLPTK